MGLKGPAGANASLVARCQDTRGAVTALGTRFTVTLATMNATWTGATVAALAAPMPPTLLQATTMTFAWQGIPRDAGQGSGNPSCMTMLTSAATNLSLADALAGSLKLALASSSAAASASNDSVTGAPLRLYTTPALSMAATELSGAYMVYTECSWDATGERVRLPPLPIAIVGGSVTLTVPGAVMTGGVPVVELLPLTPRTASGRASVVPATEAVLATAAITCRLVTLVSNGIRLTQAASVTLSTDATGGVPAVPLEVEGAQNSTADIALQCTLWGRSVQSATVRLHTSSLSLVVLGTLPRAFLPSDGTAHFAVEPGFAVEVRAGGGAALPNVSCTLASLTPQATARLGRDATKLSPDENGRVNVTGVTIQTTFTAAPVVTLELTCKRSQGDGPSPLTWNASVVMLEMEVCTQPTAAMQSQATMPSWSVGVSVNGESACGGGALSAPTAAILPSSFAFTSIICSVEPNTALNGNATLFLESATNTVTGTARTSTFDRLTVTGEQALTYIMAVSCKLGGNTLPVPFTFGVLMDGCSPGTQAVGPFCTQCPDKMYSLGGVGQPCRGCPTVGATCTAGVITLLPNFFRPADQLDLPLESDSELHPCYNSEACVVNNTALSYSCLEGYSGALCGVCIPGYAMFDGVCRPCWTPASLNSLASFLFLLLIAVCVFLALRRPSGKTSEATIALRILLGFMQALAALHVFKQGGTRAFRDMVSWTSFVSETPLSSGALTCAMKWDFISQFLTSLALPWVVIGGTVLAFLILSAAWRIRMLSFTVAAWVEDVRAYVRAGRPASTVMAVLFIGYMPIVSGSLQMMDCYDAAIDSHYYLRINMAVECGKGQHIAARTMALFMLFGYGLGYPLAIFMLLRRATREVLESPDFQSSFGFVFDGYRAGKGAPASSCRRRLGGGHLVWWESVILLRKAGIVVLAVVVKDPFYQIVGATLWLSLFFALQQRFSPYDSVLFNRLETMVLVDLFTTVSISTLLLQSSLNTDAPPDHATPAEMFITVLLVLINMATLSVLMAVLLHYWCKRAEATSRALVKKLSRSGSDMKAGAADGAGSGGMRSNPMLRLGFGGKAGGGGGGSEDGAGSPPLSPAVPVVGSPLSSPNPMLRPAPKASFEPTASVMPGGAPATTNPLHSGGKVAGVVSRRTHGLAAMLPSTPGAGVEEGKAAAGGVARGGGAGAGGSGEEAVTNALRLYSKVGGPAAGTGAGAVVRKSTVGGGGRGGASDSSSDSDTGGGAGAAKRTAPSSSSNPLSRTGGDSADTPDPGAATIENPLRAGAGTVSR